MKRKVAVLVVVVLAAVVVDQAVKSLVRSWPEGGARVDWVPGLVRWVHVENAGGVLGAFSAVPELGRVLLFGGAAVGVVLMTWFWMRRLGPRAWWSPACLGLVAGGMVGNSIDRLFRGTVTDVLVLGEVIVAPIVEPLGVLGGVPAFNFADAFLGLGLVGLTLTVASHFVVVGRGEATALDPPQRPG